MHHQAHIKNIKSGPPGGGLIALMANFLKRKKVLKDPCNSISELLLNNSDNRG